METTSPDFNTADHEPGSGITPAVQWLIALNVLVYFVQLTSPVGAADVTRWLGLSSSEFPAQWWTVGTYMFVHAGLAHLATNMIMLWLFGPRVERALGVRSFTYFYFWCGLGGAIFHLLFVQHGLVVGASGAVVGVVLAYALKWPDDEVYILGLFPMRARWLAVWTIAWNVGMALADMTGLSNGSTAWITHVGGLAFAGLYLNAPTGSSLERIRRHVATIPDDVSSNPTIPKTPRVKRRENPPSADEAVARSNAIVKRRPSTPLLTSPKPKPRTEDVNALLDKISREGMESLTMDERTFLEEISRRLRGA
ncbi:MAG: rhomboid family intramembrane serine protease [Gemmatimonadaceae bacterium]